ncbi:Uncharacterised protein [Candidatus Tiddalikarchaeum anstoanum]|nr:Uncharacterised protein [Candidatus Tiddalikarchaeum anstoanum]
MNALVHKSISLAVFGVFYCFNMFPKIINSFLHESVFNVIIGLMLAFTFSGGRFNSGNPLLFGLSPDNDFHKKMERDWLFHSAVLPTIAVIIAPYPIIYLSAFFYTSHVAVDLLNTRSWQGTQYTYIAVFLTTVLFYTLVYS